MGKMHYHIHRVCAAILLFLTIIAVGTASDFTVVHSPTTFPGDPVYVFMRDNGNVNHIKNVEVFLRENSVSIVAMDGFFIPKASVSNLNIVSIDGNGSDSTSEESVNPKINYPGSGLWAVILGVPHTLAAGNYQLVIRYTYYVSFAPLKTETVVLQRECRIQERVFAREEIALDQGMSDLRSIPTARKEREANEMLTILHSADPRALYEFTPFQYPLENPRVTSFFGDRRHYVYAGGGYANSFHNGIDYGAPIGTSVFAAGKGKVVFAGERVITGTTVIIEHLPGLFSLYFHLDRSDTRQGDIVKKGDPIGTVGQSGLVTGPHLHWEVRISWVAVDPESMLGQGLLDKFVYFSNIHTEIMAQ